MPRGGGAAGVMEQWRSGVMQSPSGANWLRWSHVEIAIADINKLRVWQDAIDLYKVVCDVYRNFPFALAKVASQNIASSDSVHRNIAEGYCRRSLKEYLQHLYSLWDL